MLELRGVTVRRGPDFSVGPVDLTVRPGRICALIGPNGVGKTTLLAGLLGLLPIQNGEIRLLGGSLASQQVRRRIGVVWQSGGLPLAVSSRRWVRQLADLYGIAPATQLLERLELRPDSRPLRLHSGGERQRWALYSALAHCPQLLVLDEPTAGLDSRGRAVFYDLIREHQAAGGATLLTSHLAQDVSLLAAEVVNLGTAQLGGIAFFATDRPLDLTASPNVCETADGYLLLESTGDPLVQVQEIARAQSAVVVSYARF